VDLVGIEPTTFPASRDALRLTPRFDQFLNGAMRFPGFQLTFATSRFRQVGNSFLKHDCLRSSTAR